MTLVSSVDLQGDGHVRDGGQFDRTRASCTRFCEAGGGAAQPMSAADCPLVDHLLGAADFLLGDETGGIDRRLSGIQPGLPRACPIPQQSARDARARQQPGTGAFVRGAIAQILGLLFVSLLVEIVGGFIVLASFGVLALVNRWTWRCRRRRGQGAAATTSKHRRQANQTSSFTDPSYAVFADSGIGQCPRARFSPEYTLKFDE